MLFPGHLFPVSSRRHLIDLLEDTDKRLRVFIAHHVGDIRDRSACVQKKSDRVVHFDAPYKGDKTNAGLISDQLGAVRDGVVEMRGHVLQRHGPVIVIDEAEDAELVVIHTLLAVHASEDRFIGIAPEDLREQQRHQIIQKAPAVAVIQLYFLIELDRH